MFGRFGTIPKSMEWRTINHRYYSTNVGYVNKDMAHSRQPDTQFSPTGISNTSSASPPCAHVQDNKLRTQTTLVVQQRTLNGHWLQLRLLHCQFEGIGGLRRRAAKTAQINEDVILRGKHSLVLGKLFSIQNHVPRGAYAQAVESSGYSAPSGLRLLTGNLSFSGRQITQGACRGEKLRYGLMVVTPQ